MARGAAADLEAALSRAATRAGAALAPPKLLIGPDAASDVASWPLADGSPTGGTVLNGMTGSIGLAPTLAALGAGYTLALANKESLIVGGPLVKAVAKPGQIVPVDSEHSALAQCLRGGRAAEVRRLILTASGGPFRGRRAADLATVTPAQALAHPTWRMGPVVTINSATLVNKGLELIEAHLLFDLPLTAIDVVVHPQSIVHSMVEFTDGSTLAQCSPPDMRLPIAMALAWPRRVPDAVPACDWTTAQTWTFEPLDAAAFPAVGLARQVGTAGGVAPAIYNAANEEAVAAFLGGDLAFTGIVDTVARVLDESAEEGTGNVEELSDVLRAETTRPRASPRFDLRHRYHRSCGDVCRADDGRTRTMMTIGILAFVVALLVSVMLHEAGHFVTAKLFGMKATQFFVGFGTTLWSRQRGETEYGVKAIPAGGFVKIIGMTPLEDVPVEDQPRAFINKPGWQRFIVLVAGSTMHFVIALVLLLILLLSWPSVVHGASQVDTVSPCVTTSADQACPAGAAPAPAVGKFKPNDIIVAVNGQPVVHGTEQLKSLLGSAPQRSGGVHRAAGWRHRQPGRHTCGCRRSDAGRRRAQGSEGHDLLKGRRHRCDNRKLPHVRHAVRRQLQGARRGAPRDRTAR